MMAMAGEQSSFNLTPRNFLSKVLAIHCFRARCLLTLSLHPKPRISGSFSCFELLQKLWDHILSTTEVLERTTYIYIATLLEEEVCKTEHALALPTYKTGFCTFKGATMRL